MTDRHAGYVVTLDRVIRADVAEVILNAIRMIKHVISVEPVITSPGMQMAEERAKWDIRAKLLDMVK